MPGTLALGATKGLTKEQALKENLLSFEDLENLKLAEDLAKTCFEMYEVTATGLAPEIAYFHTDVSFACTFFQNNNLCFCMSSLVACFGFCFNSWILISRSTLRMVLKEGIRVQCMQMT